MLELKRKFVKKRFTRKNIKRKYRGNYLSRIFLRRSLHRIYNKYISIKWVDLGNVFFPPIIQSTKEN